MELVVAAQGVPEELQAFLRENPRRSLTVLVKTRSSAGTLAAVAPFTRDYPVPEQGARYYLCRNGACAQPVDSISELEPLLRGTAQPNEDKTKPTPM